MCSEKPVGLNKDDRERCENLSVVCWKKSRQRSSNMIPVRQFSDVFRELGHGHRL